MKRAAFTIMIITIISKLFGFLREMVLSYIYGVSSITDAYLISGTIPSVIFSLICAGVSTGFIPMYSRILKSEGKQCADEYTNNLNNALMLVSTLVVVVVLAFTEPLVKLFAIGFTGDTLKTAVLFTKISVFGVYFTALSSIYGGYLRIHKNYVAPASIGFPLNSVTIMFLILSTKTNPYVLVLGSVLASASQLVFLIPFVQRIGFKYMPILRLDDEHLKTMVYIAFPIILGGSVNRINTLVDRTLASKLAVGGISALSYASRLESFVSALFVGSITTAIYPIISNMAAEGDMKRLKSSVSEAIVIVGLLVVPATVGAMIFPKEIVKLLFGRGAFTPEAIEMTATALFFYSIGMIGLVKSILTRTFYALQDTKTPMINSVIAVVINIVLNFILSRFLGIGGLALATSTAAIVSALLMFITLRKKIGGFGLRDISKTFVKICIASSVMAPIALGSFDLFAKYLRENVALLCAIAAGTLVYAILIYFMKVPEVERVLVTLRKKFKLKE